MEKLESRYDSTSTAARIAKHFGLVSTRCSSILADISTNVDRMAALSEQLRNIGTKYYETFASCMFATFIEVSDLSPVLRQSRLYRRIIGHVGSSLFSTYQ